MPRMFTSWLCRRAKSSVTTLPRCDGPACKGCSRWWPTRLGGSLLRRPPCPSHHRGRLKIGQVCREFRGHQRVLCGGLDSCAQASVVLTRMPSAIARMRQRLGPAQPLRCCDEAGFNSPPFTDCRLHMDHGWPFGLLEVRVISNAALASAHGRARLQVRAAGDSST